MFTPTVAARRHHWLVAFSAYNYKLHTSSQQKHSASFSLCKFRIVRSGRLPTEVQFPIIQEKRLHVFGHVDMAGVDPNRIAIGSLGPTSPWRRPWSPEPLKLRPESWWRYTNAFIIIIIIVDAHIPTGWGKLTLMYCMSTSDPLSLEKGQQPHALGRRIVDMVTLP